MKSLLFLLILDFSGSMYQKMDNEPKYQILQQNVRAFNQGLDDKSLQTNTGVLSFGLDAKKKCDDIIYSEVSTSQISSTVDQYRPGAFSRTPLGESIRRGTDITIQSKVKKVIIFSDGADTCGKDPCKELVKANEKLKKANYIMEMDFFAIGIAKDDPKFKCFRDNTLSNIRINYKNIGDSNDIQNELKKNEMNVAQVVAPYGLIHVKGAPAKVKFSVPNLKDKRASWFGSFTNQLKEGEYGIVTDYPGTKKVFATVVREQDKELFWADFFNDPSTRVSYVKSSFSFLLTPTATTKDIHRKVSPIVIEGSISDKLPTNVKVPFGEWNVEILSPPWMKEDAGKVTIKVEPNTPVTIKFPELFKVDWILNPNPYERWVISVKNPNKEVIDNKGTSEGANRFLLQSGVDYIPIPKGFKIEWIKASP